MKRLFAIFFLWRKPVLRTDEDALRRVTWLELFFDLVFVVTISEISHRLAGDLSLKNISHSAFLFLPVFWVWLGSTVYNDRFESDDSSHKIFTFLKMIPVAGLALSIHDAFGHTANSFASSYVAARVLLIFLWLRGGLHNPIVRPLSNRYAQGFALSAILWTVSLFIDSPWKFVLWSVGLFIDLATPLTTMNIQKNLPRLNATHMPERFGLFMIIVLGESVIGAIDGISSSGLMGIETEAVGFLGLILAFSLWWLYFDNVMEEPIKKGVWWTAAWAYSHLPLAMSVTAIGVGILQVIQQGGTELTNDVRYFLCGACAMAILSTFTIEQTLLKKQYRFLCMRPQETMRGLSVLVFLVLAFFGNNISPIALLSVIIFMIGAQITHGCMDTSNAPMFDWRSWLKKDQTNSKNTLDLESKK